MTYKQLLAILQSQSEDMLEQTATIYLDQTDEYIAVSHVSFSDETNDVLDEGHMVIEANF